MTKGGGAAQPSQTIRGRIAFQGLKAARESDGGTEADEGVQRLIRRRIEGYPDEAKANMHHARSVNGKYLRLPF